MFGLALALLYGVYSMFVRHIPAETAFLGGAGWLYTWYWVWAIIGIGFTTVLMLLTTLGIAGALSSSAYTQFGRRMGLIAGAGGGILLSLFVLALSAVSNGLFIGAAWCFKTSGVPGQTFGDFDNQKLIVGGVLLLVGILFRGRSSSSSSKSND